jgi:hypothetical protein
MKLKARTKNIIKLIGVSFMFYTTLLLMYSFVLAYLSPAKISTININSVGEANIEMWLLLPVILIFGALTVYFIFQDFRRKK